MSAIRDLLKISFLSGSDDDLRAISELRRHLSADTIRLSTVGLGTSDGAVTVAILRQLGCAWCEANGVALDACCAGRCSAARVLDSCLSGRPMLVVPFFSPPVGLLFEGTGKHELDDHPLAKLGWW